MALVRFLIYFCILIPIQSRAEPRFENYKGFAQSQDGKLIYQEDHKVTFDDDRIVRSVTRYLKPDGTEFAQMDSDYARSIALPTYIFKDNSRGYEEGVAFENGKYVVFFKDKGGERESKILDEADAYSCQGWHYYLINNLERVESDQLKLRLILPGKLESFQFEFKKLESTPELLTVKLQVSNWFLNIFAPSLRLVYNKKSKRLIKYNGVSNILDANGKTQDVEITYKYL